MATKEIHNRYQQVVDSLTLPFLTALISSEKLPNRVRNLKWGDYLVILAFSVIFYFTCIAINNTFLGYYL